MKRFDPLTYRHPRTINEAFPGAAEYANAFEGHVDIQPMPKADKLVTVVGIIGGVAVVVLAVLRALPGGGA